MTDEEKECKICKTKTIWYVYAKNGFICDDKESCNQNMKRIQNNTLT